MVRLNSHYLIPECPDSVLYFFTIKTGRHEFVILNMKLRQLWIMGLLPSEVGLLEAHLGHQNLGVRKRARRLASSSELKTKGKFNNSSLCSL